MYILLVFLYLSAPYSKVADFEKISTYNTIEECERVGEKISNKLKIKHTEFDFVCVKE